MVEGTVDSTVDSAEAGAWLSLADAARALGVSEKTARRRARAGQLEARQVPTQRGPAWQVRLPIGVPIVDRVDSHGTQAATADRGATMLELVRLVGELQPKAEAAAMWQARAELLAERLAAAESKMAALEAPRSPTDASTGPHSAEPTADTFAARLRPLALWLVTALAIVAVLVLLAFR
jgi:hypothetical protein